MALLAGTVINHARDLHPALSEANAPAPLGYRHLTRLQGKLVQQITAREPAFLAETVTVPFPLADFAAGYDLSVLLTNGWLDILNAMGQWTQSPDATAWTVRCKNVPWSQRDMVQSFPAFSIRNNIFFPIGDATMWAQIASVKITATANPADITEDASTFVLPVDALDALASDLAAFYVSRLVGEPAYRITEAAVREKRKVATDEIDLFLERVWQVGRRQSYRVRNVRGRR